MSRSEAKPTVDQHAQMQFMQTSSILSERVNP